MEVFESEAMMNAVPCYPFARYIVTVDVYICKAVHIVMYVQHMFNVGARA
jgi:hypothetical protein